MCSRNRLRLLTSVRTIGRNSRAVGVEYVPNSRIHPGASQDVLTAQARRLVVVSGGSLGSPLILERSGIGAKGILEKLGIPVVVDLPGVGDQYQGTHSDCIDHSVYS